MDFIAYVLFRFISVLLAAFPLKLVFAAGKALGTVFYYLLPKYRKLVFSNLTIAFGNEKSREEIRSIARQHFAALGGNMLSGLRLASMTLEEVLKHVTFENWEHAEKAHAQGKGILMVISHIGNWELYTKIIMTIRSKRYATVFQKLGNPYLDKSVREERARMGVELIERKEGFAKATATLREGGILGILIDQHAGDGGTWVPFFDRLASTSPLAATLALRTGAALIPSAIYTEGNGKWRVTAEMPIVPDSKDIGLLTAKLNKALENQIRRAPADWFWVHNRWKTPSPKFLLSDYKRGISVPEGLALKPFNILIRSSNWLGDAVMTVPAVRAIKRGRPDARVTILTKPKLADFWKRVEGVDNVISIENSDSVFRVAKKIRDQFDVAILLPNSPRVALEAWLGGIPRRVGYRAKWRSKLLNQIIKEKKEIRPPRHQVYHYLELAKQIGAPVDEEIAAFKQAQPKRAESIRIGLCPGAEYGPAKRWPAEKFAEVAGKISERRTCEWVLFGTGKDAEIGDVIEKQLNGNVVNLIGKTTLNELMDHLSGCRLLLTNDTGTMHLAAFLNVPTVAIFGSTEPTLTGPLGDYHRILRHRVECSPCFLRDCPIDFRCMNAIEADEVVEAVLRFFDN